MKDVDEGETYDILVRLHHCASRLNQSLTLTQVQVTRYWSMLLATKSKIP
jgi:hypothetical protein